MCVKCWRLVCADLMTTPFVPRSLCPPSSFLLRFPLSSLQPSLSALPFYILFSFSRRRFIQRNRDSGELEKPRELSETEQREADKAETQR